QITSVAPFVEALEKIAHLVMTLKDIEIKLKYVDLGGGLGITYKDEQPPTPEDLADQIIPLIKKIGLKIIFEPGRYIAAGAGILVSRVLFIKQTDVKTFVIVDGAMNDLARPFIYDAYHEIIPLKEDNNKTIMADVVGGVCESTDYFARNRPLPLLEQGDCIALLNAGAYGFVMSGTYNSRPRVPEVMVAGGKYFIIRRRETYEDLIRTEEIPDI
ncbi:MAG: diaminopimelate decarboxylase, partial [bacterium]